MTVPTVGALTAPARLATGLVVIALGVLTLAVRGTGAHGLVTAFAVCVLVALTAIDIDRRIVPNVIVLPSALLVLGAQIASQPDRTGEWLAAAFGAAGVMLVLALVNPKGLGMGDVKLALLMGATLGSQVVAAFFVACLALLPAACWILVRRGTAGRKDTLPLVPFLAFGVVVVALAA